MEPPAVSRVLSNRAVRFALVLSTCAAGLVPVAILSGASPASASSLSTYAPGTPQLATITNGTSSAPWNEWQGDPGTAPYSSVGSGTVLPTYTPGGASTGSGTSAEPNVSVMPGAGSGTDGVAPYPSGTVGTPGALDGYCGTGNQTTESAGAPVRQPAGTTLPLAPAYFPHIVANTDGSLTGYFDYRPKDADEAVEVARSTDGGKGWIYEGEALEQNPGYCPSDDINDDGNGHPFVLTVGGVSRLYTLQRAAGDTNGVGMLVHTLSPTPANPLAGAPATEKVGIDPNSFVSAGGGLTVPSTGGVTIAVGSTGTAGSTLQLVAGGFVDLTATPTPTAASVITCSAVTATSLTGCTSATAGGEAISAGDLIEQVIGYVGAGVTVPTGPNTTTGDGGLGTITVVTAHTGGTAGFTLPLTGTTFNNNAPNRAYIDGVPVYCDQSNASPTTKMEDCTTGPGAPALTVAAGDPITDDPIIPATATMTSGLVAPDGIVGQLPSYPGAPAGSTIVMYTEKELNYYVAGTTTNSAAVKFSASTTLTFTPSPYTAQDLGTVSAANPVTVSVGDITTSTIVPVTCTGLTFGTTDSLTGCTAAGVGANDQYNATSLIGAPGATTVSQATLALTGEGSGVPSSAKNVAKLMKNNEDLAVIRVAYTTDGIDFSTAGLDNGGVISGQSNGASNYTDLTNPSTNVSPSNLNAYATPGTPDADELRWAGSAGSIITNPDGSYGLFLSGSWAADGDSDAFNQIFYSSSTDGEHWTVPTTVVSTDYTFSASAAQDAALAAGHDAPLGISAYYSGRAYGPTVVPNANGTLTMLFAGYRIPKTIASAGTVLGTNPNAPYTIGATDPTAYRNILVETLTSSTSPGVGTTTVVTANPPTPIAGASVTYTATVTVPSPGTGIPTGTVSFTGNAGTICSAVTLSDTVPDTATCTTSYSSAQQDTVTATYSGDSNYATSAGSLAVTVDASPVVSLSPVSKTVTAGASVTFTAAATGTPTPTVEWEVSFDGGTTWTVIPGATSTSYTIMTTTPAMDQSRYRAVFTNGIAPDAATTSALLTVDYAPVFVTSSSVAFTTGQANTFTIGTAAEPLATLTRTGTLPAGVTFTAHSNGTATLAGTPPTSAAGPYSIVVTAKNSVGSTKQTITIEVTPPTITPPAVVPTVSNGFLLVFPQAVRNGQTVGLTLNGWAHYAPITFGWYTKAGALKLSGSWGAANSTGVWTDTPTLALSSLTPGTTYIVYAMGTSPQGTPRYVKAQVTYLG
jgi:hypothetical protein